MPAGARSLIVGGVQEGAPFTTGQIPYIQNDTPPTLADSIMRRASDGAIVIGTTDPEPNDAARTRTKGGLISEGVGTDSTVLGEDASAGQLEAITIGKSATSGGTGQVVIGVRATVSSIGTAIVIGRDSASGGNAVVVGEAAAASGTTGNSAVAVGHAASAQFANAIAIGHGALARSSCTVVGALADAATQGTCVGDSSRTTGQHSTAMGYIARGDAAGAVAIGRSAQTSAADSIVIGADQGGVASTISAAGTGSILIGGEGSVTHANCIVLGREAVSIGANHCQLGAAGTPITTFVLGAGDTKTGVAVDRSIRFTNGSGTDNAAGAVTIAAPRSTGAGAPGEILFQVGTAGASSAVLQTLTDTLRLVAGGTIRVFNRPRFDATTATGADALTLGNGPAGTAGNPDAYLSVSANGTNGVIPVWFTP